MSKFLIIKYREKPKEDIEGKLRSIFNQISAKEIENRIEVISSQKCENLWIAKLNPLYPVIDSGVFTSGQKMKGTSGTDALPDGSYSEIRYNEKEIRFNVDFFETKSIWYVLDDEKLILSDSQRAIVALKGEFKLNEKVIPWFLSAGNLGFANSWDMEIVKVQKNKEYIYDCEKGSLITVAKEYYTFDSPAKTQEKLQVFFRSIIEKGIPKLGEEIKLANCVLAMSGGYDSRTLFYMMRTFPAYRDIRLVNWGIRDLPFYNDKVVSQNVANSYKQELLDFELPDRLTDLDVFFDKYVKLGADCRIDHFNAYADHFKIFETLSKKKIKLLFRADVPFPDVLYNDEKNMRFLVGFPLLKDYKNHKKYDLEKWLELQEGMRIDFGRKTGESSVEWRDRLYNDFRFPYQNSAYTELTSNFIEVCTPMLNWNMFYAYSLLEDKVKLRKGHMVKMAKKMDKSGFRFKSQPALASMKQLLNTQEGKRFLLEFLKTESNLFSSKLRKHLENEIQSLKPNKQNRKNQLIGEWLKYNVFNHLPKLLIKKIKSSVPKELDAITLTYRMMLIEKTKEQLGKDSRLEG